MSWTIVTRSSALLAFMLVFVNVSGSAQSASSRPNVVMLMTDDTGWNDFGVYSGGGAALGHPTPNIDRFAKEGAYFTNWYGQASCTAGRASFMTGRIPIRTALSVVVGPGDRNHLTKETPTIAEFFQKNGYTTYFSGKYHLGDVPESYPIEHGFDELLKIAGDAVHDTHNLCRCKGRFERIASRLPLGAALLSFQGGRSFETTSTTAVIRR